MKVLKKYYKQGLSKERLRALETINQTLKLKLDVKQSKDLLALSVYEEGLKNKKFFEEKFELIRHENLDLWDNLSFVERNFIIKCDSAADKVQLKSFKADEVLITIPFFDVLLNGLYDRETAILELPQFFKLYKDFDARLIPVSTYGIKPYLANMAFARYIASVKNKVVLFYEEGAIFYLIDGDQVYDYPIEIRRHDHQNVIVAGSQLLESEALFLDVLIDQAMISDKCIKKIEKYRKKGKLA